MKCEVCGCENKENALFCAECGKALKENPIALDLQQIKVPATSRKAHIVKVSTKKSEPAPQQTDKEAPAQENMVLFNPEKAAVEQAEMDAQRAQAQAKEEKTQEEQQEEYSDFISLQTVPEHTGGSEGNAAAADEHSPVTAPMTIKNWIPVFLLSLIPVVNLIMLFVWSFSSRTNKSKQSFARLSLIVTLICVILAVIAAILMATLFQVNFSTLLQEVKL